MSRAFEVPDVDEIFDGGKFVKSYKDYTEEFDKIEQWLYEGVVYEIGRSRHQGVSILLSHRTLPRKMNRRGKK